MNAYFVEQSNTNADFTDQTDNEYSSDLQELYPLTPSFTNYECVTTSESESLPSFNDEFPQNTCYQISALSSSSPSEYFTSNDFQLPSPVTLPLPTDAARAPTITGSGTENDMQRRICGDDVADDVAALVAKKRPNSSDLASTLNGKSCLGNSLGGVGSANGAAGGDSEKKYFCDECNKAFKFQTSLLRHNNKTHNWKYRCQKCCRVFSRQSYLDVHITKPGTSCFLGFTVLQSLANNKKLHHK